MCDRESVEDTPPNHWPNNGEKDPFDDYLGKKRKDLALGQYTDDELANGVFMNGDMPLDILKACKPESNYHPPIAWLTAGKERIRWLSRKLIAAEQEIARLKAELEEKDSDK